VTIRKLNNEAVAIGEREDIVDMWRAAVQGGAAPRRAFLLRIMPSAAISTQPDVIEFEAHAARLRPARAA
jgi:hypothetical protein